MLTVAMRSHRFCLFVVLLVSFVSLSFSAFIDFVAVDSIALFFLLAVTLSL